MAANLTVTGSTNLATTFTSTLNAVTINATNINGTLNGPVNVGAGMIQFATNAPSPSNAIPFALSYTAGNATIQSFGPIAIVANTDTSPLNNTEGVAIMAGVNLSGVSSVAGVWISESVFNWKGSTVVTAANYNNYAPSLRGDGASGTWGINVSGTAFSTGMLTGAAHTNGSDGWFRSVGQSGWYSDTYGVGIYATQAGQVSTYNGATFTASRVYNAVWNDIADFLEFDAGEIVGDVQYGYVYITNERAGGKVTTADRYASPGLIGIASDTFGFGVGRKDDSVPQLPIAIGGIVLAKIDRLYPAGTALTSHKDGGLTKARWYTRMLHPERVVATFHRKESRAQWNGIEVNSRHWVKVK
jgi:hypothetical protein